MVIADATTVVTGTCSMTEEGLAAMIGGIATATTAVRAAKTPRTELATTTI